jgi:hypothetical protein
MQTNWFADGLRLLPREIFLLFPSGTIVVHFKNTFSNEPCPDISSCAKRGSFARHPRSMQTADIRIAFAWFKELIQKGRTNTFFAYPTENT